MPVKGKTTKSRTAKSKGKGLKLKWWYILPVIAIVAIAGYSIVRFSEASSVWWSIPAQNLNSREYVRKGNGTVWAKLPATAVHGNRGGQVCATIIGPEGVYVNIRTVEIASKKSRSNGSNIPKGGTMDLCTNVDGAKQTTAKTHTTTLSVPNFQGNVTVWVTRVYQKR